MEKRIISYNEIYKSVYNLILNTSYILPTDVYNSLKNQISIEESNLGKSILEKIIQKCRYR